MLGHIKSFRAMRLSRSEMEGLFSFGQIVGAGLGDTRRTSPSGDKRRSPLSRTDGGRRRSGQHNDFPGRRTERRRGRTNAQLSFIQLARTSTSNELYRGIYTWANAQPTHAHCPLAAAPLALPLARRTTRPSPSKRNNPSACTR
jgi:hypothetical protein